MRTVYSVHPIGTQMLAVADGQRMIPTKPLPTTKKKSFIQQVKSWHTMPHKNMLGMVTLCASFPTGIYIVARSTVRRAVATSNGTEVAVLPQIQVAIFITLLQMHTHKK